MRNDNKIRVTLTGADPESSLMLLTQYGIPLYDIRREDQLNASFSVSAGYRFRIVGILTPKGDHIEFHSAGILNAAMGWIKSRCILLIECIFLMFLTFYIPSKILFIQVEGNRNIPQRLILETVTQYGLHFGADRESVRSNEIKNCLLTEITELEWVGVTTNGCVATVKVKEKPSLQKENEPKHIVSSIISSFDGIIEEITVTEGTPLCKKGQAVRQGQVLISGYEDCGLVIKAGRAQGEVFAQTFRKISAITPLNGLRREGATVTERRNFLQIGKNIINFNKNSGISPPGCAKIYEEKYIMLPGGFQLPVAWITETVISYDMSCSACEDSEGEFIASAAEDYIQAQMVAGEILQKKAEHFWDEDVCIYTAQYLCREQIGKNRIEETLEHYGKSG